MRDLVQTSECQRPSNDVWLQLRAEPLLGLQTELPVDEDFAVWICSPRRAVDWLLHAMTMDTSSMGADRGVNPPGMRARVGDMLAALEAEHGGS